MNREFKTGDKVQHFKRQWIEDKSQPTYTYEIIGIAMHTETEEQLVVYKALYGECKMYARPYDMFVEEVDKEKYPDSEQKYRFELCR